MHSNETSLNTRASVTLTTLQEGRLPHLPFIDNQSDNSAEDKRTTETVQHARLINYQHKSLTGIDIKTAEVTAKLVNMGKILSGLLVFLTSSKLRDEGAAISNLPQKKEEKHFEPKERPSSVAPKQPRIPAPLHKIQGLEPVTENKGQVSHTDNDCKDTMVITNPTHREDTAPEDTPAVERRLLEESNSTTGSSKGGKASKKNDQARKQTVNESSTTTGSSKGGKASKKTNKARKQTVNDGMRHNVASAVSAYPTQRPPRKKLARKSTTIKESLPKEKLGPGECDSELVQKTREPTLQGSEHDDHKEVAPEQSLVPEEASQKDDASLESSSEGHQESVYHTPEESFDREWIASDVRLPGSNVFDGKDLMESSSEGHDESGFYTPVESFDQGWNAADPGLLSGDFFDREDLIGTTERLVDSSSHEQPIQEYGSGAEVYYGLTRPMPLSTRL